MDPASLTTLTIAIARAAFATGIDLHTLILKLKDVPSTLRSLHHCPCLIAPLTNRMSNYINTNAGLLSHEERGALRASLIECKKLLAGIRKYVQPLTGKNGIGFGGRVKHLW